MKIIQEMIQGSTEWLQWRKSKISATNAAVILDLNPFQSKLQLWQEKVLGWEKVLSDKELKRMQLGTDMEPVARALYIEQTGQEVFPVCAESSVYDFIAASFDGLTVNASSAVEIKCGKSAFMSARKGEIPPYYYAQMQHQMYVAELEWIHYFTYYEFSHILLTVNRNEQFIANMVEKEKEFWQSIVELKAPMD